MVIDTNTARLQFLGLGLVLLLGVCWGSAQAALVSLDVSPATPTSGNWAAGELVEIILQVAVDGQQDQGFSGADFKGGGRGLTADTNYVKIHDILYDNTVQVDTEALATAYDPLPGYEMDDDSWWYDPFTDFIGTADFTDSSLEAVAGAPVGAGLELGLSGPIDYLHLVLEIQPAMAVLGTSTEVAFVGQLVSYDLAGPNQVDIFGTLTGGNTGSGSFTLTNLPEPHTALLFLAVVGGLFRHRRRPAK